jgi:sortase A
MIGRKATLALMAAGVVCLAASGWIHVKAVVAQMLINAAWLRERAGQGDTRPWPWADTRPVARLTFGADAAGSPLVVLEGSSGRNLAFGPTHDPASVLPGGPGNSVIEGHRDTHFALLRAARVGDPVVIETLGGARLNFVVTRVDVADTRRERIALWAERPRVTLVTCYPFDAVVPGGPLRWVVTAEQVRSQGGKPGPRTVSRG